MFSLFHEEQIQANKKLYLSVSQGAMPVKFKKKYISVEKKEIDCDDCQAQLLFFHHYRRNGIRSQLLINISVFEKLELGLPFWFLSKT